MKIVLFRVCRANVCLLYSLCIVCANATLRFLTCLLARLFGGRAQKTHARRTRTKNHSLTFFILEWFKKKNQLEYDLDLYNIVAVDNFNMGAMENKSLNVFNTAYVLADEKTATDTDFERVEAVIGHEYFHNWTGNRVTCRT